MTIFGRNLDARHKKRFGLFNAADASCFVHVIMYSNLRMMHACGVKSLERLLSLSFWSGPRSTSGKTGGLPTWRMQVDLLSELALSG